MGPAAKRLALRSQEFWPRRRVQDCAERVSEIQQVPPAIPVSRASRICLPTRLRSVVELLTVRRVAVAQRAVEIGRADLQSLVQILTL